MHKLNEMFLKTNLCQISVNKILVEKLKPSLEYLTYNVRRYNVPVTMILFYTEEDISSLLRVSIRLTDVIETVQIADSYFNFVFLPFTEEEDSYTFVEHVEYTRLNNADSLFYLAKLEPTIHNYYNFINSYLFEILEKKERSF